MRTLKSSSAGFGSFVSDKSVINARTNQWRMKQFTRISYSYLMNTKNKGAKCGEDGEINEFSVSSKTKTLI